MKTGKLILKIFAVLILCISLFYAFIFCTKNEESGVKFGNIITDYQNFYSNLIFRNNIKKVLNHNEDGLIYLVEIPTGGAHGYEMGYIITQIIYKVGEQNFKSMLLNLSYEQQLNALSYIDVGLEYGDNDYDGEMDNTKFEDEFPILYEYYNSMRDK